MAKSVIAPLVVPQRPDDQRGVGDLVKRREDGRETAPSTRPGQSPGARRARRRTRRRRRTAAPCAAASKSSRGAGHQASATPSRVPDRSRSAEHRAGRVPAPRRDGRHQRHPAAARSGHHRSRPGGRHPLLRAVELRRQPPPAAATRCRRGRRRRASPARRRRRAATPRPPTTPNRGAQLLGERADELGAVPAPVRPPTTATGSSASRGSWSGSASSGPVRRLLPAARRPPSRCSGIPAAAAMSAS